MKTPQSKQQQWWLAGLHESGCHHCGPLCGRQEMKIQVTSFLSYHSSALHVINLKYFKYFRFFFSILMKVICTFMGEEQGNFQLLLIGLNEPHSGADGDVIWYWDSPARGPPSWPCRLQRSGPAFLKESIVLFRGSGVTSFILLITILSGWRGLNDSGPQWPSNLSCHSLKHNINFLCWGSTVGPRHPRQTGAACSHYCFSRPLNPSAAAEDRTECREKAEEGRWMWRMKGSASPCWGPFCSETGSYHTIFPTTASCIQSSFKDKLRV